MVDARRILRLAVQARKVPGYRESNGSNVGSTPTWLIIGSAARLRGCAGMDKAANTDKAFSSNAVAAISNYGKVLPGVLSLLAKHPAFFQASHLWLVFSFYPGWRRSLLRRQPGKVKTMETIAKSASGKINMKSLPDGEFSGTWGGYVVDANIGNSVVRFDVEHGIRTIAAPCVVIITEGNVTVRLES